MRDEISAFLTQDGLVQDAGKTAVAEFQIASIQSIHPHVQISPIHAVGDGETVASAVDEAKAEIGDLDPADVEQVPLLLFFRPAAEVEDSFQVVVFPFSGQE